MCDIPVEMSGHISHGVWRRVLYKLDVKGKAMRLEIF